MKLKLNFVGAGMVGTACADRRMAELRHSQVVDAKSCEGARPPPWPKDHLCGGVGIRPLRRPDRRRERPILRTIGIPDAVGQLRPDSMLEGAGPDGLYAHVPGGRPRASWKSRPGPTAFAGVVPGPIAKPTARTGCVR